MLTAAQQDHYARHLLLDGFGGEGQERLLALAVEVRGAGVAARWAARYLAASGAGRLAVDARFVAECRALAPFSVVTEGPGEAGARIVEVFDEVTPAASAMQGAQAALDLLRSLA